jgi:L-malate glycosyltransferase
MIKVLHLVTESDHMPYFSALVAGCDRARFDTSVASLEPSGKLQKDMAELRTASFTLGCTQRWHYAWAIVRLALRLRRERYDIIQTHLFDASVVGLIAAFLARTPVRILANHHSHDIVLHKRLLSGWLDKALNGLLCDHVIAPSQWLKKLLIDDMGIRASKISVIPYSFDPTPYLSPAADDRERLRAEWGIGGGVLFGSVSRLHWVKDIPSLLVAFSKVRITHPTCRLVVVGDGPERDTLISIAQDQGVADAVVFAGFRRDLVQIYSALDVFVHTSLGEAGCQVIPEAMASGKPVISTRVGVVSDILEDGITGRLVSPGDPDAFADAMLAVLERRSEWPAIGCENRARAETLHPSNIVPLSEQLYVALMNEAFT